MTDDRKPLPAHRQAARDWVDWLWDRKGPALLAEIAQQHLARGKRGFRPGHAYHPPGSKDTTDDKR